MSVNASRFRTKSHRSKKDIPDNITSSEVSENLYLSFDSDMTSNNLVFDMTDRNAFLTKTGMFMVCYVGIWVVISIAILLHRNYARVLWISMEMQIFFWLYLVLAFLIKCFGSFCIAYSRKWMKILFGLDCIFSGLAFFGSFYYFENILPNAYQYSGHYVIMCSFLFLTTAFGFIFSTLFRKKDQYYSTGVGILLMSLFNFIAIAFFNIFYPIATMKPSKYIALFFCYFFFNCYIAFNSKLIVMRRSKKFFENEAIFCFFTYCTDWFSYFWIDWCRSKFDGKKEDDKRSKVTQLISLISRMKVFCPKIYLEE